MGQHKGERMENLSTKMVRRLALARAGLLSSTHSGLPTRAAGKGQRALTKCEQVIERFGYLQLDSIAVSGARSQGIVLCSRLAGLDASVVDTLLRPGQPYFEYWGHEACWMPMALYPYFAFRRREFRVHPWWGDLLGEHRSLADALLKRIANHGPLRSVDLDSEQRDPRGTGGWGSEKLQKRIAESLWCAGELAIRERRGFQRVFDLTERVIPLEIRSQKVSEDDSFDRLLLGALSGHGWATEGTLAATWRLKNCRDQIQASLERLREDEQIVRCDLQHAERRFPGWIRCHDLEQASHLNSARLHGQRGIVLSPFDPVLWDRARVKLLFGFEQSVEIYKPAAQRVYGYYCLPVLAGERLIARMDLKADRKARQIQVLAFHSEDLNQTKAKRAQLTQIAQAALQRFAQSVALEPMPLT